MLLAVHPLTLIDLAVLPLELPDTFRLAVDKVAIVK
jgi:hypothetical protein